MRKPERDSQTPALPNRIRPAGQVSMSRALVNAAHGLTLNEKRLVMAALRQLDSRLSPYRYAPDGIVKVRVSVEAFAAVAGLPPISPGQQASAAYEGLSDATDHLFERTITFFDGPKGKIRNRIRWVITARYYAGEGWTELHFHPAVAPHILQLRNKFVRYELDLARGVRSVYTWRLLELLMQWKDTGLYRVGLEEFRAILEIPPGWRYGQIKRDCLDRATTEINEKTGLLLQWRPHKRGRSVSSLEFSFVPSPERTETAAPRATSAAGRPPTSAPESTAPCPAPVVLESRRSGMARKLRGCGGS